LTIPHRNKLTVGVGGIDALVVESLSRCAVQEDGYDEELEDIAARIESNLE